MRGCELRQNCKRPRSADESVRADMIKKVPHKIDMGAVYTKEPNQKAYISKDAFKEVSREFILDIDLTDYQEDGTIKSNCIDPTDPDFCKSWKFMAIACKVCACVRAQL